MPQRPITQEQMTQARTLGLEAIDAATIKTSADYITASGSFSSDGYDDYYTWRSMPHHVTLWYDAADKLLAVGVSDMCGDPSKTNYHTYALLLPQHPTRPDKWIIALTVEKFNMLTQYTQELPRAYSVLCTYDHVGVLRSCKRIENGSPLPSRPQR